MKFQFYFWAISFLNVSITYTISKAVELKVLGQWAMWLHYIQQNFSQKSLLAITLNFSSFCISSTYDTLPSPSNLKRWKFAPEVSCFPCNKDTFGACKVALSQGKSTFCQEKFTFCHVWRIIITNIRSFTKNIKSKVPTTKQPIKIKFVEKGVRVKNEDFSPSGILIRHQTGSC